MLETPRWRHDLMATAAKPSRQLPEQLFRTSRPPGCSNDLQEELREATAMASSRRPPRPTRALAEEVLRPTAEVPQLLGAQLLHVHLPQGQGLWIHRFHRALYIRLTANHQEHTKTSME